MTIATRKISCSLIAWLSCLCFSIAPAQTGSSKIEKAPPRPAVAAPADTAHSSKTADIPYDRVAQFLAGMPDSKGASPIPISHEADWKTFSKEMEDAWSKYEIQRLGKMREWAKTELIPIKDTSSILFYPFGGPDFLHALTFFPNCNTYILIGLERPGTIANIPHLADEQLAHLYHDVEKSLQTILRLSFFRTLEMDSDLRAGEIKGTLPIVLLFMARQQCTIKEIKDIALGLDGSVLSGAALAGSKPMGYEIRFANSEGHEKLLLYLSVNLEDSKLKLYPNFNAYIEKLGRVTTFVKSASYLMHMLEFGTIRQIILAQSDVVLQDDSGIPLRYFVPKSWDITLYGTYEQPIQMFANFTQDSLRKAYEIQQPHSVKPLTFSVGYGKVNKSNLLLAKYKDTKRSAP